MFVILVSEYFTHKNSPFGFCLQMNSLYQFLHYVLWIGIRTSYKNKKEQKYRSAERSSSTQYCNQTLWGNWHHRKRNFHYKTCVDKRDPSRKHMLLSAILSRWAFCGSHVQNHLTCTWPKTAVADYLGQLSNLHLDLLFMISSSQVGYFYEQLSQLSSVTGRCHNIFDN